MQPPGTYHRLRVKSNSRSPHHVNEEQLIKGCVRRDRIAQKYFYDTFSPKMYPLCCRYVKDPDDAEDVLVTSFTHILDRIGQYRGEGSFEGWIKRAVINEALSFLRKKKNMYMTTQLDDVDTAMIPHHDNDTLEQEDLLRMIGELPPGYRAVFNMYAIDGFSHQEIAAQMNISENTSKSQLSRARVYLQKLLAAREPSTKQLRHDIASR
ncbi:MAG: RNA polymerase sigma factor [Saprospiraceae bacterium]|nr:RNA polymerase sigma factor [Candidatus Opimibacter skivensis]